MSALENLKEKLRAKPNVDLDLKQVDIVVPVASKPEEVKFSNVAIRDKREISGFNMADLTKKLKDRKLTKLVVSPLVEKTVELEVEPLALPPKKKSKKLSGKSLLVLQEEGVSILPGEAEPIEAVELGPEPELESEALEVKKKPRKTSKLPKGVAILPPEAWVQFGDTSLIQRLPEKQPKVNYKVSSYYMNNREIFVNFINSTFEPYRDQVLDDSAQMSCEDLSNSSGDYSLLTHQKLVRDYLNLYTPYRGLLLYHGLGSGKCMAKDTPILMYDGSTKMVQDIQIGELLMGDDSTPRTVISLARGKDKMYDVIPIKGEKYTVNQAHILCLKASGFPKIENNNRENNTSYNIQWIENNKFQSKTYTYNNENKDEMHILSTKFFHDIKSNEKTNNNIIEISVIDYLNLSNKRKGFLKGYKVPIEFPEKELPIDPYMIGYWLGDGSSGGSKISCQDSTVLHYFAKNLPKYRLSLNYSCQYDYGISGNGKRKGNLFLTALKDLDLLNNKHIPIIYKCNSRENRLKLLAGLLDSDGHYNKNGGFEFTNKNEKLIDDVIFLARSLGFSSYKHKKDTSWTYNGKKKYGTAWRIQINGQGIECIPNLIPRKRAEPRMQIKDALVTGIKVEYAKEDDYYGFVLDGNSRYLIGDFTVTHNTLSSIAIAEGMKGAKKVIVMTPASLEDNYRLELKKAGDPLYKLNQCWEWVSTLKNPEVADTLSSVLNLPLEYIRKKGGAWLVDVTKPPNCNANLVKSPAQLQQDQVSLNEQIDMMIETKYQFIHYNGLRRDKLRKMTNNFETNFFDDSIIIIDEAHNLISRIVNKIGKEKEIAMDKTGKREKVNISIALILYEMLLTAQNARIVLLTGTPIINYPNEIGILFNILRGYIKTWEIPLDLKGSQTVNKEVLQGIFTREKVMDYMDYSPSSKVLTVTRNPFGFENKEKKGSGYHGVTNEQKMRKGERGELVLQERGIISDADFERRLIYILRENGIEVFPTGIRVHMYKALPDKLEEFSNWFIESGTMNIKNSELFKRRIMGLASYFRSAQESLLPAYEKVADYHIVKVPMSDYQFGIYEAARQQERKQETSSKKKKGKVDENGVFVEPTSTYRIFSRLYCNFVMPKAVGRPLPKEDREVRGEESEAKIESKEIRGLDKLYEEVLENADKVQKEDDDREDEMEGDEIIEKFADATYEKRLRTAMEKLKRGASQYLSPEGLETYSPKYLNILENIQDPDKIGLHLVYSQFRTLEGIGIFKLVLEENGFAQFKLKKDPAGVWQIDIADEDRGKPTFALYTGTETKEEKELVRKIYNGLWNELPPSLSSELKEIAHNNNTGEIIKVFMITASGSEGINLRNTRYVHIVEPYWHPVRTEQVIGRARRICSHKDLPEALQTVEVYVYLMKFTREQLLSNASIELKVKDLSKREYNITPDAEKPKFEKLPFTSDETLFEISTIKEEVSNQLIKSVKESSIDCAIYSRLGSKEQLHCLQFADATASEFSYNPSLKSDEPDSMAQINKQPLQWKGKEIPLLGKIYIYRKIDKNRGNIYDLDSYKQAEKIPGLQPILIGTLEKMPNGDMKYTKI